VQIGHSKPRAVLIMYFWSALISFTVVMFSVSSQSRPIVLGAMGFALIGLTGLLLPQLRKHLDARAGRVPTVKLRGRHAAREETAVERQPALSGSGLDNTPPTQP
jgi:UDP-GlcNAc:undecaprenyl-phosphate GlcNAc-1-phosphate transferase